MSQAPPRTAPARCRLLGAVFVLPTVLLVADCGKKGPPLPPLIRLPAAPDAFVAERQAGLVEIRFLVPAANTDGTRPADVERVEVWALTGPRSASDAEILRLGTRVGTLAVKAPRDPDRTVDPDEPLSDLDPLEGPGLDQGAVARLTDALTAAALTPVALDRLEPLPPDPLFAPMTVPVRLYVAIGVSTRGRRGAISARAVVPLVPPPAAPDAPEVTYDERQVSVSWAMPTAPTPPAEWLPSRSIWPPPVERGFHVYEVPAADGTGSDAPRATRLTKDVAAEPPFVDPRIEWGVERCYAVRVVRRIDDLPLESEASAPACLALADVFPPPAPTGLRAIASGGAINLIWDPVDAADLAGYVVLRAAPGDPLRPSAVPPIQEATYRDEVATGSRYVYAVQSVDKAGNASPPSNEVEETAR